MHTTIHSLTTLHRTLRVLPAFALIASALLAHGDAIPVTPDRKNVTVECLTFTLDQDQVKEVEQRRKLTLTDDQMAPLWNLYDQAPRTIDVVSSQYDSCTCGMGIYGIWCRPGEVKIPLESVAEEMKKATPEDNSAEARESEIPGPGAPGHDSTRVILDAAGRSYLDGVEQKEADILTLIDTLSERQKKDDWLSLWITLDVPPPQDEATDTRIRELAARIEAHCKTRGVGFWALGLSADKFR